MARHKIVINDISNIRDVLQEAYNACDELLIQSLNEITKLTNSTPLGDEIVENKAKYVKAITDLMAVREKALGRKIEIAKLLTEIYKHNGNIKELANDSEAMKGSPFDLSKIREIVNQGINNNQEDKTIIHLKK